MDGASRSLSAKVQHEHTGSTNQHEVSPFFLPYDPNLDLRYFSVMTFRVKKKRMLSVWEK